jgi:hypothetical protein
MDNPYPLETPRATAWTTRLQVRALIADLLQSIELLTAEIEQEEARLGVHDVSAPTYPVLARSLRARRENIRVTIGSLGALVQGTPKAA